MASELVSEKKLQEAEQAFKASVFITVIDTAIDIINKNLNYQFENCSVNVGVIHIA